MNKQPAVYILASKRNGTLYIGVTSDLVKRIWEHKNNMVEGGVNHGCCRNHEKNKKVRAISFSDIKGGLWRKGLILPEDRRG